MLRTMFFIAMMVWVPVSTAFAAPISYDIVVDESRLEFTYFFGKDKITGRFPDFDADLAIDFDNPPASTVAARISTTTANGGFPFASQALKSERMLNAARFPEITFRSTKVSGTGNTAQVIGDITVRGVTKPVQLTAKLFRDTGTTAAERQNLIIVITGQLNRHDFGVSGWPNDVGETLGLEITARITARR